MMSFVLRDKLSKPSWLNKGEMVADQKENQNKTSLKLLISNCDFKYFLGL